MQPPELANGHYPLHRVDRPQPDAPLAVDMVAITKHFPGVTANDSVDFALRSGEIHALLGENGAGKTTLMQILCGLYEPDGGEIRLFGQPVRFHSPRAAIAAGVGMVYQHFMLVDSFTVADNIVLGQSNRLWREDPQQLHQRLRELGDRYGLRVDPAAAVWQLSVGEQQRVEILKAIYRGARVLILDEPTAVLTPQEVEELLHILRTLADQGTSIVFISHKLNEVMAVCDRVTVLRDGKTVGTVETAHCDERRLAEMMVGRQISAPPARTPCELREPLLLLKGVEAENDRGLPALKGIDLTVQGGEILGIAGVDGNGQRELEEVIVGLRRLKAGQINCHAALAHIPSDRYSMGLLPDFSVAENAVLRDVDRPPFQQRGLLNLAAIQRFALRLVDYFRIRTPSVQTPAGKLSGGNAQRVVLARELARHQHQTDPEPGVTTAPLLILAAQPTRGLDISGIEYVHQQLLAQRQAGAAILLISTELEEILRLSDRIAVLYEGNVMAILDREAVDTHQLGLLMAGRTEP